MMFIKENKGFISLLDGILAIFILLIGLLVFNSVLNFPASSSYDNQVDSKIANDVMELMTLKIDENSYSILESVVVILKDNDNNLNYETKNDVSNILGGFFK